MQVTILRGIPGSGKSTWVNEYWSRMGPGTYPCVCSADHFHMVGKEYKYDPKNTGKAHAACLLKFQAELFAERSAYDEIIVDNTNTSAWEIAPYYALSLAAGADVKIVTLACDPKNAIQRGIHSVPASTVWRMHQSILSERLPAHWKEEIVFVD